MTEGAATSRPGRARAKSVRTRARILDAAATVLAQRGYAETRIGDVAELAEMQGPALYYHFASRDELIEEVIATGQRGVLQHVAAALEGVRADPLTRILDAAGAHLEYVLTTSPYASASIRNFAQLPEAMQDRQVRLRQEYGAVWRGLFAAAETAGALNPGLDVHAARMLVLGALNWTCEWWDPAKGDLASLLASARGFLSPALAPGGGPLSDSAGPGPAALPDTDTVSDSDERKAARSRRRITEAAARVLRRRGYAGTRLTDVAAAAEMQTASLYYHFSSRDELIEEVVRAGVRMTDAHVRAVLAALPADAPPVDRLDAAVEAHLSFCLRSPDLTVATIRNAGQLPAAMAGRLRAAESEYGDVWRALLRDLAEAGSLPPGTDERVVRMLVLGALNQTAEWSDRSRGVGPVVRTARLMVRNALVQRGPAVGAAADLLPLFRAPGA